jgi:hypothetical protein
MENVYEQISTFYAQNLEIEGILAKDLVERYLRKCAWRGGKDEQLKRVWNEISGILVYIDDLDLFSFDSLDIYDYQEILCRTEAGTSSSESCVEAFFQDIMQFYKYLIGLGYIDNYDTLSNAQKLFYHDSVFKFPDVQGTDQYYELLRHLDEVAPEQVEQLNSLLDTLLNKVGEYFRQAVFLADLTRAVMLYTEPFGDDAHKEDEEFWFSFWDYFFFDYHLIQTDLVPLVYFYEHEKQNLQPSEIYILKDLMKAKFTVFSIDAISEEFIQCTNLFTGDKIDLPCPEYNFVDYKKMILFGHIHSHGMMLLNYITSVPASKRLRQRMKDEILRQYELYQCQDAGASLQDFFSRHAAAVRHTINILSFFAQLKVVLPKSILPSDIPFAANKVEASMREKLSGIATQLGYSAFSVRLLIRMYGDFLIVAEGKSADEDIYMAAILILFADINGLEFIKIERIKKYLSVQADQVSGMVEKISNAMDCKDLNPRYLTEEGFVQALFMV